MTGRHFYIDHNTRKTTWVRPASPLPAPTARTPDSATPVGGSPDGSSDDLASAADAASEAAVAPANAEPDAEVAGKPEVQRFGLFGLSVDEVRA